MNFRVVYYFESQTLVHGSAHDVQQQLEDFKLGVSREVSDDLGG